MRLRLALATPILLLLIACGQTGPLYLPGNPSEVQTAPPAGNDESAEDDAERQNPER